MKKPKVTRRRRAVPQSGNGGLQAALQSERVFFNGAAAWPWPLAAAEPPPPPSLEAMKRAEAYVDPSRLITAQMFVPYNPSVLVTRKGLAVFDAMSLDEQVKASLAFKVLAVLAGGWEVVSPGDEEDDWEVTTFVRDVLTYFPGGWNAALKKFLRALRYGYSVTEKVYAEREAGALKGKLVLDRLVELKPHYLDFECDASGKVLAVKQMPTAGQKNDGVFPPEKFVHYAYDREFENAYGKSDLEAAYRPWWVKDNAYKWLAIVLERYGIPPLFAMYDPNQYQGAQLEELKKVVRNIQAATMGIIPRGTKDGLEFWSQTLAAGSQELFTSALARFDADIAKALLQPSLTGFAQESGSQGAQSGGSLARSQTSWKSFMLVVRELQADVAVSAVNAQVIPQLCDLNFPNLAAYPEFRFARLDDETEMELFRVWSELVTGKVVNRIEDDERHIRKSFGMPDNDTPTLEELPGDVAAKAKADALKKGIDPDAAQPGFGKKPKKLPAEELSEEMRAFAEKNDGEWVELDDGYVVCFAADGADDGVWRTINGRRVFIRKGQSVDDALRESLGGKRQERVRNKDKSVTVYHGTLAKNVASIRKEGIRGPAYVTQSENLAMVYSNRHQKGGAQTVLFTLKVPKSDWASFKKGFGSEFFSDKKIPPEWIANADTLVEGKRQRIFAEEATGEETAYCVALVEDDEE